MRLILPVQFRDNIVRRFYVLELIGAYLGILKYLWRGKDRDAQIPE